MNRDHEWSYWLLLFLTLLLYYPVLSGKVPIPADEVLGYPGFSTVEPMPPVPRHAEMGDLVTQVFPWRHFAAETIRSGHLPLWNPQLLSGAPFIANHQSAVFYPLNVFYYGLEVSTAWSIGFILRFFLSATFCMWYARSLGISRPGSFIAGVAFATCGFLTAWNGWAHVDSAIWLPLVLLSTDRLRSRVSPSRVAFVAIAYSMPILAGHPEIGFYVCTTGVLYAVFRLVAPLPTETDEESRIRFVLGFGAAGLTAVAVCGVQLLPTLEWIATLQRPLGERVVWPPRDLGEIVSFFSRDHRMEKSTAGISIPEGATYAGILTIALAFLSPLARNRWREVSFFWLLLFIAIQVIYGFGPAYTLVSHLPILESLPNTRLILVADFSLAILAAFGFTVFEQQFQVSTRRAAFWCLLVGGSATCVAGAVLVARRTPTLPPGFPWMLSPQSSILIAVLSFLVLLPLGSAKGRGLMVAALLTIEMVTFSHGHVPFVDRRFVFPVPPLYRWIIDSDRSVFRVGNIDETFGSNCSMLFGMESPLGYDFPTRRTEQLLSTLRTEAPDSIASEKLTSSTRPLLDMLNVKYLITSYSGSTERVGAMAGTRLVKEDGGLRLFLNESAMGRTFLVPSAGIRQVATDQEALERLRAAGFDPRSEVIVTGSASSVNAGTVTQGHEMSIISENAGTNEFTTRVRTTESAVLVFSDLHYPGWKVLVNNREAQLLLVNFAFKGVVVPSGTSEVRFEYDPLSVRLGLASTGVGLMILVILFALNRQIALPPQRLQT